MMFWSCYRQCRDAACGVSGDGASPVSTDNSFSIASKILLDGFLHHRPARPMLRFRERPAVLIFRRVVGDAAIHIRDLNAHWTPCCIDRFPSSRECMALFLAAAYAQSCSLGKDRLCQTIRIFHFRKYGEQCPGTALLHLYRDAEYIKR